MDKLSNRLGYDLDARANLGLGFAEFDLKGQAVSVRLYPALDLVAEFKARDLGLGGFDAPPICLPAKDDERGYE